jgi:VanZ family protein
VVLCRRFGFSVPVAGARHGTHRVSGQLEHFVAYAGSAAIAMAGYGLNRDAARVIGCFWLCAGILEYLQHFSPGRHPAVEDFAASAMGALFGGVAVVLLWRHRSTLLGWRHTT